MNRIDPSLFARCFESFVSSMWPNKHDFIAIDGMTARRTHDKAKGLKALHTLSAYATNAQLTLARLSVPEKTNEITAIPDLLDTLAEAKQLQGAVVTIDAMGCQVAIAQKILDHGAHYVVSLKGNQPTLEADVTDYFRTAPAAEVVSKTTLEKGHGRIETRRYVASSKVDWIASDRRYPGEPNLRAAHDHAHGVIEIGPLHLVFDGDGSYVKRRGDRRFSGQDIRTIIVKGDSGEDPGITQPVARL